MKILIVSGESFPGHEGRNLPLAQELISRGHEVIHSGPLTEMISEGFKATVYNSEFAKSKDAIKANTRLFSSWRMLEEHIDWAEVILFGTAKHYESAADYAKQKNKIILWQRDVGPMHWWAHHPDAIAVRGDFDARRDRLLQRNDDLIIRTTGCIQFDDAAPQNQQLSKRDFCTKYGLDESKETAVFISTAPSHHSDLVKTIYKKICEIGQAAPGLNFIIKPHPREFGRSKQGTRYEDVETPTWKQLAPGIPACEPSDKYDCFLHSDVLITLNSAIFLEAAMFKKPLLEVALPESYIQRGGAFGLSDLSPYLSGKRFAPPARKPWFKLGRLQTENGHVPEGPIRDWIRFHIEWHKKYYPAGGPDLIGSECSLAELPQILASGAYKVKDNSIFDDYISEYCYRNDGLAYKRIADFVESVESDPQMSEKLSRLRSSPLSIFFNGLMNCKRA